MPVACALSAGRIARCDVTLTAKVGGREVVVGRGHRTLAGRGTRRKAAVRVTLTPLGRALAQRLGGTRVRIRAEIRQRGASRSLVTRGASRVVAPRVRLPRPVFFDSASAALRPGELRYLRRLRPHLDGAKRLACTGYTDSRNSNGYNRALGLARARAVCAVLSRGTRLGTLRVTRGEGRPFASNATARGMQLNRRTEIHVEY